MENTTHKVQREGAFVYLLTEDNKGNLLNRWWFKVSSACQPHEASNEECEAIASRIVDFLNNEKK